MKLCIGEFVFDPEARELCLGRRTLRLEPKAAAVLLRLADAANGTVRRADLLDACWPSADGSDEALTQAIAQVRRAFSLTPDAKQYIHTVARTGYRLMADVRPASTFEATAVPRPGVTAAATPNAGFAPYWLAVAGLALAVSAIALTVAPHGLRHWLIHHLQ